MVMVHKYDIILKGLLVSFHLRGSLFPLKTFSRVLRPQNVPKLVYKSMEYCNNLWCTTCMLPACVICMWAYCKYACRQRDKSSGLWLSELACLICSNIVNFQPWILILILWNKGWHGCPMCMLLFAPLARFPYYVQRITIVNALSHWQCWHLTHPPLATVGPWVQARILYPYILV